MTIYIRFEQNKQVETTTLEDKPGEGNWYEAPENFDWRKSYYLTKGGGIAERSEKDIQKELLDNAKRCALGSIRTYYDNYTYKYSGSSHQKAKSYAIQAKAAENILEFSKSELPFAAKDSEVIEPLAKVREISVTEMAELIQEKAQKAVRAIAKCEELEDLAKKRIEKAKTQEELQDFLNNFEQEIEKALTNL